MEKERNRLDSLIAYWSPNSRISITVDSAEFSASALFSVCRIVIPSNLLQSKIEFRLWLCVSSDCMIVFFSFLTTLSTKDFTSHSRHSNIGAYKGNNNIHDPQIYNHSLYKATSWSRKEKRKFKRSIKKTHYIDTRENKRKWEKGKN